MLKAAGFRIRYVNFGRHPDTIPDVEGYNGLIILGGPMGVYETARYPHLKVELQVIEQAIKADIPVLGICLGAQLIAAALGAHVRKAKAWELGWYKIALTPHGEQDPLFEKYQGQEKLFQLHQDEFEPPKTATHLAFSEMVPGQAFRYGDKVYGLQFHLEADQAMIFRWLGRAENRELIQQSNGLFTPDQLRDETNACIARSLELSTSTFGRFIEMFQLPGRHVILGSR